MNPVSQVEEWMFSTVRIETNDNENNTWTATGFIFGYPVGNDKSIPFLVTNRHVIENQIKAKLFLMKGKNGNHVEKDGMTIPIGNLEKFWHFHPDPKIDIAVMSFSKIIKHVEDSNEEIYFKMISGNIIPTKTDYDDIDAMENILFIGYPSGLYDKSNLTPIIRKGITATPIYQDYEDDKKYLVDATVFPGSSGSPVFIYDDNLHWGKKDRMPKDSRILFVGIISKNLTFDNEGKIIVREFPAKKEKIPLIYENIHLGIVLKPENIIETIKEIFKDTDLEKINSKPYRKI